MIDQVDTPGAEYVKEAIELYFGPGDGGEFEAMLWQEGKHDYQVELTRIAAELQRRDEAHALALQRERAEARREAIEECGDKLKAIADEYDAEIVPGLDPLRHAGLCAIRNTLWEAEEAIRALLIPPPMNTQWQEFCEPAINNQEQQA
jgi:predicted DNA-binding protein